MTEASLRYENEQLKRKLLQTQEERDRAMSNCHELWKRLNSLISLAASTTASYTLSSSGLPTSPSDSYDSRSKSTSPNSSAASLNDSLLSTSTTTNTTNNNNNTQTNNQLASNNNNNNNNQQIASNNNKLSSSPLNLKSVTAIKSERNNSLYHANAPNNTNGAHQNNNNNHHHHQLAHNQLAHQQHLNISTNNSHSQPNNQLQNQANNNNNQTPLNLKSVNAIKDINNNHPLIAEVAKVTTVGEIEEIAPGQFKCRYCDKTFDRIFSVHRHERVHTGFKPCVCKACGRGFSEKRNLRHHIIRFHSDGSGRELLKRNRNKSATAAAAAAATAAALVQQHQQQLQNLQQSTSDIKSLSSVLTGHQQQQQQQNQRDRDQQQNQQHLSKEPLDTTGLNVLGAAAAVITVSSSSSRRRKSKPSKKINFLNYLA